MSIVCLCGDNFPERTMRKWKICAINLACFQLTSIQIKSSHVYFSFRLPGPAFWGLINPEWSLCNKGRRQSPVNLEPQRLLFDPNLRPLHIDKHRVSSNLVLIYCGHIWLSLKSTWQGLDTHIFYHCLPLPTTVFSG